jgi:hypothetical protein
MGAKKTQRWWGHLLRVSLALAALLIVSGKADVVAQQVLDICGCAGTPGLVDFDASQPSTYPPGTSGCAAAGCNQGTITFTLPPDGVMRFRSFTALGGFHIRFTQNAANTPVTLLVAGNVTLESIFGCCFNLSVSGDAGSNGTASTAGVGGGAGHGGFRGGDGSALAINGFDVGGAGFGPGGGGPATPTAGAAGGTFFGVPELLPLVGGSGGGGGSGFGAGANCTGGGGGGGGGGLLIAANGTLRLVNYQIFADGASGGSVGNGSCARGGGGGSGGAIRVLAASFTGGGAAQFLARAGGGGHTSSAGTQGRIRFETVDPSAQTVFTADPPAIRMTGPGPISNPVAPSVAITHVNGGAVPAHPQGWRGSIDVVLPAPGVTGVDVATTGVPSGTTVRITAKSRMGGMVEVSTVALAACDTQGQCTASTTFNLPAGAFTIEARATFEVP